MKKDIFIDTNVASKFSNPQDPEYIKLTKWLMHFDESDESNKDNYAHLVLSNKLIAEYLRSSIGADQTSSIPIIIAKLQRDGRWNMKSNKEIADFKTTHFSKKILRNLNSNAEDHDHIALVLLSDRKMALSYDEKLCNDILNFPGHSCLVAKRPENLPYR